MSTTIEQLELQVQSSSTSAVSGIDALSASLSKLKTATKGGVGLTSVANSVRSLDTALKSMDASGASKIDTLANSLEKLKNLGSLKISSSIGNQLKNIGSAAASLTGVDFSGIERLCTALSPLSSLNASGLKSTVNALNKLPQLAQTLNGMDIGTFTSQLRQISSALTPLANQLNAVSAAYSRLPANIQRTVTATNRITSANNRASTSYVNLWAKMNLALNAVKHGARTIASWIHQSNQYVEDLNLFNASMGQYTEEAQKYAETVSEALGIDPGEFMRNQGTFNTIISGFGVASDKAYLMSKNLTQLGYDVASFYNISFEDAMQKLQSGISGELEPLRRLGYDLSVARLQEEALALGIGKKVSAMTQAEKSQLRYYAIMTQVTTAQGDMARTLNAPANQLRVLQAQVTQCARALGNIFIPALNAVLPYAIAFVKIVRMMADSIASLVGFTLPEVDYSGLDKVADSSSDIADSMQEATEEAKKFKKTIMGFDELNLLNDNSDTDSSTIGNSLIPDVDLGVKLPEYDFLEKAINTKVDAIVDLVRDAMWEIMSIISVCLLAIGTILVVTGANIPLGLGLMVVGAMGLAAVIIANWDSMSDRLAKVLGTLTLALGVFHLAIGTILAVSGANLPLGIALMALGAAEIVTGAVINWNSIKDNMESVLSILTGIVGIATLALGALLAFSGVNLPLGIALIAAGAVGLVTAVGLNWESMPDTLRRVIGGLEMAVGAAMLVLGVIIAFAGVALPLGIALIAAGAVSLVSAVALNWGTLTGNVKDAIQTIVELVSGVSLAIGMVIAFSGVNLPLGIALIAAGAVGLVTAVGLNWESMPDTLRRVIGGLEMAVGAAMLVLGVIIAFAGVALPLGIALIAAGAVSLVSAVALNWGTLTGNVKDAIQTIVELVSGVSLAIGMVIAFSGVNLPLGIALIAAGAVGLVTAAGLNWESLSDELKNTLSTITATISTFLLAIGVILAVTGVNLPLGIGLIAAGAVALGTAISLNWSTIVEEIKKVFSTIGRLFVGVSLVAIGIMLLCTGAGAPLGVGLIAAGASALAKPESFNVQELVQIGKNAIEGLENGVRTAWEGFSSFWENLFKKAIDWVKNFFGIHSPSTVFQNIGLNLVAGLKNGLQNIGDTFTSVFSTISTSLGNFGHNMFTWGSEMMGNLVTGINSGLNKLKEKVSSAADTIRSYLHFSQPDVGPLADFNTWMPDMMSQLASGIANDEHKVRKQVEKLAGSMNIESTLQANVSSHGAVTPTATGADDSNSGLVSAVYKAVSSAIAEQNGGEGGGTPIIINLGNEQIASFLVKQNKRVALISGGKV